MTELTSVTNKYKATKTGGDVYSMQEEVKTKDITGKNVTIYESTGDQTKAGLEQQKKNYEQKISDIDEMIKAIDAT